MIYEIHQNDNEVFGWAITFKLSEPVLAVVVMNAKFCQRTFEFGI